MRLAKNCLAALGMVFILTMTSESCTFADSPDPNNIAVSESSDPVDVTPDAVITNLDEVKNVKEGASGEYLYSFNDVDGVQVSGTATFSSDDPDVLSVTEDGKWSALKQGTAMVWVSASYSEETLEVLRQHFAGRETYIREKTNWGFEVTVADAGEKVYRIYNPNSGEHFFTKSEEEKDYLTGIGWRYEGIAWLAPKSTGSAVYRLYNANAGDHFYTINENERDVLVKAGWRYEGISGYANSENGYAVYRVYNPNAKAGAHHFTTNEKEYRFLIQLGWRDEGVAWYAAGI